MKKWKNHDGNETQISEKIAKGDTSKILMIMKRNIYLRKKIYHSRFSSGRKKNGVPRRGQERPPTPPHPPAVALSLSGDPMSCAPHEKLKKRGVDNGWLLFTHIGLRG